MPQVTDQVNLTIRAPGHSSRCKRPGYLFNGDRLVSNAVFGRAFNRQQLLNAVVRWLVYTR
jgi:hypothetical protein